MTDIIYVNTSKQVGDPDHLKVFANADAAETWLEENDPEGVAFEYEVLEELRFGLLSELGVIRGFIVNGVYPASHRLHKGILRGLFNEVHLLLPTQDAGELREQAEQGEPEHAEVVLARRDRTVGDPCDQFDRRLGLRVRRLRHGLHGGVQCLPPVDNRLLALPAVPANTASAFPIARGHRVTEGRLSRRDGRRGA